MILDELSTLPGDLDGNGDVSFSDFLTLATNFGAQSASYTDGDINLEHGVTFEDFLVLSKNFGQTPGSTVAAAVPEPFSMLIAMLGLLVASGLRRVMAKM